MTAGQTVLPFLSRENPGFFASVALVCVENMWQEIGIALCLVLVFEGVLPFLSPKRWRESVVLLSGLPDQQLRLIGLASMLLGTAALYWLH
ncbi:Uncharacterized conserved protein YjeT, DUF2065 family [Pseudomonas pohangensis]|jgi:hypothetical protein|uniref:Uncharacterized conserved protein YjeT, DUF2065 family n=2 Tax=Pseudomonas pohangensis TaxID=364197 RepID=A0A1H2H3D4_9PSED|nr:Uncharacterized conserved protein YjeT, DUF2065 family [Pseudomonas pohangensis]